VRIIYAVDRHFKHCNLECTSSHVAAEIVTHVDSILCRRPGSVAHHDTRLTTTQQDKIDKPYCKSSSSSIVKRNS